MVTPLNVENVFTYHPPEDDKQLNAYHDVRTYGLALAKAILANVPDCPDQQAAIRHVREAVMTANAGIALKGAM